MPLSVPVPTRNFTQMQRMKDNNVLRSVPVWVDGVTRTYEILNRIYEIRNQLMSLYLTYSCNKSPTLSDQLDSQEILFSVRVWIANSNNNNNIDIIVSSSMFWIQNEMLSGRPLNNRSSCCYRTYPIFDPARLSSAIERHPFFFKQKKNLQQMSSSFFPIHLSYLFSLQIYDTCNGQSTL